MTRLESQAAMAIFNCPMMSVAVLDKSGRISSLNASMSSLLGVKTGGAAGLVFVSFFEKADADSLSEALASVAAGGYIDGLSLTVGGRSMKAAVSHSRDSLIVYISPETDIQKAESRLDKLPENEHKQEFLCNIFHGIKDAVILHSADGRILNCNARALELFGADENAVRNTAYLEKLSSDDINTDVFKMFFREAVAGNDQTFTWQLKRASDGAVLDVEVFLTRVDKDSERIVMSCVRDITDKKRIEDELINSERRYRQLVEYSPDGIVIHRAGVLKYINPAGAKILGGTEDELLGRSVIDFFLPEDRVRIQARLKRLYEENESLPVVEGRIMRLDGKIAYVEYAAIPFSLDSRVAVQVVLRDITEKKAQDEFIRHMALHDNLTGLPNRSLLTDRISQSIERRKRDKKMSAIIYIDLDGFKPINDTLGHGAGDMALKEVARRLNHAVRKSDTAARIGGDEFVVLLDAVHEKSEITTIAGRIRDSINKELIIDSTVFHIGASMGISIYPDDSDDHVRLLALADRAMYRVKETGKNRFAFWGDME